MAEEYYSSRDYGKALTWVDGLSSVTGYGACVFQMSYFTAVNDMLT